MILTAKGRYAVMAMVDLAVNAKDSTVCLADIAKRQEITVPYLEQIFAQLKAAGLVRSVRGPGGGYLLAKLADEINIAEILLATDEDIKATRCHDNRRGCLNDNSRCMTHHLWESLGEHILKFMQGITLQDVCNKNINSLLQDSDLNNKLNVNLV